MAKVILFQGDSITDAGRDRNNNGPEATRGFGYATMVAGELGFENPNEYEFYNRGVSGNRVLDLYARIVNDTLNLKPDYLSILIGVNDVWHEINNQNGVATEKFEKIYSMLIEEIKDELPDIKIIILEPFVLKASATQEHWEEFKTGAKEKGEASKRVAEKFGLSFVSLQDKFDEAMERLPDATYWTYDGVHPAPAGHAIIGKALIEEFEKIK